MVQAGELRERVSILTLAEKEDGSGWEWQESKKTWAKVEQTGRRSLFSTVGVSRPEWRVSMRRQPLTLFQALRWRDRFLFLAEQTFPDRGHMELSAVQTDIVDCTVRRTKVERDAMNRPTLTTDCVLSFPACLTEKYSGFSQGDTHDTLTQTLVAICPKAVTLQAGEVVTIGDARYRVQIEHTLSEYKNEYEITREEDT